MQSRDRCDFKYFVSKQLFVALPESVLFFHYAPKFTSIEFGFFRTCCFCNRRYKPWNVFLCTLFGASFINRFTLELIVSTNASNLSTYEEVHFSSKYLSIIFFRERIFHSTKADFSHWTYCIKKFRIHCIGLWGHLKTLYHHQPNFLRLFRLDHLFEDLCFLCGIFCFQWLNPKISWQTVSNHKQIFYTTVLFCKFINIC